VSTDEDSLFCTVEMDALYQAMVPFAECGSRELNFIPMLRSG